MGLKEVKEHLINVTSPLSPRKYELDWLEAMADAMVEVCSPRAQSVKSPEVMSPVIWKAGTPQLEDYGGDTGAWLEALMNLASPRRRRLARSGTMERLVNSERRA